MGQLSDLKPEGVFKYFEELCGIPHGSGNTREISDYLVRFAKEHDLKYIQDELGNVIIFAPASEGYEDCETTIIQGHMDMVAVKKPNCDIDMATQPLKVRHTDEYVYAEGTSLGGDDGIAIAFALAIMDDKTIKHPALEVVITIDEEVGMEGASGLDLSVTKGKRVLNLDNEEEGVLIVSCAGGARVDLALPVSYERTEGVLTSIKVCGLQGGHSGAEIHKERGNAIVLLARVLYELSKESDVHLLSIEGGLADNAIPREACASLLITDDSFVGAINALSRIDENISEELSVKDPEFKICVSFGKPRYNGTSFEDLQDVFPSYDMIGQYMTEVNALSYVDSAKAIAFASSMPNGVCSNSADIAGLVQTSTNIGMASLSEEKGELVLTHCVRSSVESEKVALIDRLENICFLAGAKMSVHGVYPGWSYRQESPLRDKMVRIYKELFGTDLKVMAIHAGLECGILTSKISGADCVSYGPQMESIHTTEEKLYIDSVKRTWEFVLKILEDKE